MFKLFLSNLDSVPVDGKSIIERYSQEKTLNLRSQIDVINTLNALIKYMKLYMHYETHEIRRRARTANLMAMLIEIMDYLTANKFIQFTIESVKVKDLKEWAKTYLQWMLAPSIEALSDEAFSSWIDENMNKTSKLSFQISLASHSSIEATLKNKLNDLKKCIAGGDDLTPLVLSYFMTENSQILDLLNQCVNILPYSYPHIKIGRNNCG